MGKKLYKSRTDVKVDGVCAGIAKYLNVDVTFVRLIWIIASFCTAGVTGIIAYFVCAAIMPRESAAMPHAPKEEFDDYREQKY